MVSKRRRNTPNHPASSLGPPQEHGQRHLSYFAHAPLPVMVVDASGRFVEVNPAACRIGGYEEAELLAMSFEDVLAEESLEAGRQFFARVKEVGQASGEFCWTRKDGSRRWSTCEAAKLSEDRFLGFFLDVTDLKRTEETLRANEREIKLLNRLYAALSELNQSIARVKSREDCSRNCAGSPRKRRDSSLRGSARLKTRLIGSFRLRVVGINRTISTRSRSMPTTGRRGVVRPAGASGRTKCSLSMTLQATLA